MKILFCCQFYAPSVGGVQEVMRQVAERLVQRGHKVVVATTRLRERDFETLNGVMIEQFEVSGNLASGMVGEFDRYRQFVVNGDFDLVMIKAAQQWTFDALWAVLDDIRIPKVFIPCGFSGFSEPAYSSYYERMVEVLGKFDRLIFYASTYRDIDFARKNGIAKYCVIPNGASEIEFSVAPDPSFRSRHGIPESSFLMLTVGSFTGLKGHHELVRAFAQIELPGGRHSTLILNGNVVAASSRGFRSKVARLSGFLRMHGLVHSLMRLSKKIGGGECSPQKLAAILNKRESDKTVLVTDFPRHELVQAYFAADLFVFASKIEYSPLVLFEAAAAGTPFLTVDVGNSEEIARWTGAGVICPSVVDEFGYTNVDEGLLAHAISELVSQRERLEKLGADGRENWLRQFTWEKIASEYERLFGQVLREHT